MAHKAVRMINALANYIERKVKDEEFDMGTYGTVGSCGTYGCAAFHAAQMPMFKNVGLRAVDACHGNFWVQHGPSGEDGRDSVLAAVGLPTLSEAKKHPAANALRKLFGAGDLRAQTRLGTAKRLREIAAFKALQ